MRLTILISALLLTAFFSAFKADNMPMPSKETNIVFHWEDKFSKSEKTKIKTWLNVTSKATFNLLGNYPFDLHFHLYRSANAKEPVPWANTIRSDKQGVDFYVNPDFDLEDFMNDWTAPHEISHLAIPAVSPGNSWFAEGFATFMQGEILVEMNELTPTEMGEKYQKKRERARPYFDSSKSFVEIASRLKRNHHYPEMYWAGAGFFVKIDEYLQESKGIKLSDLIKRYQECCRLSDGSPEEIMASFDKIAADNFPTRLLADYQEKKARDVF